MKYRLRLRASAMTLMLMLMIPLNVSAQDAQSLPDNFDQLIEVKNVLLQTFSAQRKAGQQSEATKTLQTIVDIHWKAYQLAQADPKLSESVQPLRNTYLSDGQFLSDQLFIQKDYAAAGKLRRKIHEMFVTSLGEKDPKSRNMHWMAVFAEKMAVAPVAAQEAYVAASVASKQVDQNQHAIAELAFQNLVNAEIQIVGTNHHNVAEHLGRLGALQLNQKKFDIAEATLLRSLKSREGISDRGLNYAVTLFNLARTYEGSAKLGEAEKAYLAAADIEKSILGSTHESYLQTLNQIARLYQQTKDEQKLVGIRKQISAADPVNAVLNHLPGATVAAALMEPANLVVDPSLELFPFEVIKTIGMTELQFDPFGVRAVAAFILQPEASRLDFGFVFVEQADQASNVLFNDASAQSVQYQGTTYLKQQTGNMPLCMARFDDRVMVVGTERAVQQCLTNPAASMAQSLLKAARGQRHLLAAVDVTALRPTLNEATAELPPAAPPAISNLKTLIGQVNSLQIQMDLSLATQLIFNCTDEATAPRVSATLASAISFSQGMAQSAIDAELDQDTPGRQATNAYAKRVAMKYFKELEPVVEGTTVKMQFRGVDNLVAPSTTGLLILPAVIAARDSARQMSSMNSMKQVGLAMHNYMSVHDRFPGQAILSADSKPLLSWRVAILPFLEQVELYEQFHLDEPWNSEHNLKLAARMPEVFRSEVVDDANKTNVMSFVGKGAFFDGPQGFQFRDFTDGTSNTLMLVEANPQQAVVWTQPADLPFNPSDPSAGLGSHRDGGFLGVMVDGATRRISSAISLETLLRIITRNGGEVVDEF